MARTIGFIAALMLALPLQAAEEKCELQRYAEMPITMAGTRPLIEGTIEGKPTRFVFDSGAFFSFLSRESAERYGLKVGAAPPQLRVRGVGGAVQVGLARVKDFTLAGFGGGRVFNNVEFLVGPSSFANDTAGLIGQNVIGEADSEYDLANGFIRLFRTEGCKGQMLAYWHAGAAVAEMTIEATNAASPHLIGTAKLNGKKIRVVFDTGAWRSVLTRQAAARAGIEPEDEGVSAGGLGRGLGKQALETWLARFDTLDLGGEVIKNARLRIADFAMGNGDMLLGADFFLSHRIYVASRQRKIYFTYNGGPVFDLRRNMNDPKSSPAQPIVAAAGADATATAELDAAALRRRGAAAAGRGDTKSALADLDRAVNLDAGDAENYFHRGMTYWQSGQPVPAAADFDAALKLKPDHVSALMARGSLRLGHGNLSGASADFDAAALASPSDSSLGLRAASSFVGAGHFEAAIPRLNAWIAANPKHDQLAGALNERCWSRAVLGKELDLALADCNTALKKGPRNSAVLDSRALVHLRLGKLDNAMADYRAALKLQPKQAISMYGLGLAQVKKGMSLEGEKAMQAALQLNPRVAERFKQAGVTP